MNIFLNADQDGDTPLMIAVNNDDETALVLIKIGADIRAKNKVSIIIQTQ
jgi:ankyrin repeat protein